MTLFKIVAGFLALILTFVAISLLFAPALPILSQLTGGQQFLYAAGGFISLGVAVAIWLWATKLSELPKP